jgi:hypothetical protein
MCDVFNLKQLHKRGRLHPPVCEEEVLVKWPRELKPQALEHIRLQRHCAQQQQQQQRYAERKPLLLV